MAKTYWAAFGTDPRVTSGQSPTFVIFQTGTGATVAPPTVTEPLAGSGFYKFTYGPTASIVFLLDAGAAISSSDRYISGALDPIQAVDEKVGTTDDSFGSTSVDPTTLFGFAKRNLEFEEGNASFNKSTGVWDISSRGSSTLLREKTLANSTTAVSKS